MRKIISVVLLCTLLFCLTACGKKDDPTVERDSEPEVASVEPEPDPSELSENPLTGITDISAAKAENRPVAIMINNLSTAQPVQAGLSKADIIFETEVEGGITRLLAVFQDVSKAGKIGSIRSARYVYVDLAMGLNALYLHRGQDDTYCGPHLKDIDDVDVSESNYGFRESNGLSKEHTLYTSGKKLWDGLVKDGRKTKNDNPKPWVTFAEETDTVQLSEKASKITVTFPGSGNSNFVYDEKTGLYTRCFNDTVRTDYFTKEKTEVKNVFVLLTSIQSYPDGYHMRVDLESGEGYYAVNGTYEKILWSKGEAKNGFTFTKADGTPLTVNPGKSFVCIANKNTSKQVFE